MAVKNIILKDADGDYVIPYVGIPSQTGNAGKVLGTNGENLEFVEKQDTLVSGTNIKTINNTSILGSGNIDIQSGGSYTAGDGIIIENGKISVDGEEANLLTLATVATSGSYNDLINKPTIPTVGNATITITQGGVTKGSFTTNQSTNATIELDSGGSGSDVEAFTATEVQTIWESI